MANGNYQPFIPPNPNGIPFGSVQPNDGSLYNMKSSTIRASANAVSALGDSMYQNSLNQNKGIDPGGKIAQSIIQYAQSNISFSNSSDPTVQKDYSDFLAKYTDLMTKAQQVVGSDLTAQQDVWKQNAISILEANKGKDGYVNPDVAKTVVDSWIAADPKNNTASNFLQYLKPYLDPYNPNYASEIQAPKSFLTGAIDQVIDSFKNPGAAFNAATGNESSTVIPGKSSPVSVVIPKSSALAYNNNNPGNLKFAGQSGAVKGAGGFAKFSDPVSGFNALKDQIGIYAQKGMTLAAMITKYAPPSENNTKQYISQIASTLGVSPTTKVSQVDADALAKAIATKESSTKVG